MTVGHLVVIAYTLGILPTMYGVLHAYNKAVEEGVTIDLSLTTSRRNMMLIFFGIGLSWPALVFGVAIMKILKPLWKDGPPDDPDDPEEQLS